MADLFASDTPAARFIFSPDRRHRYIWEKIWDASLPPLAMIALNPSTADEVAGDPTVDRMVARARRWGHGRFIMLNAAAFRSTDPAGIYGNPDAVGDANDEWIDRIVHEIVEAGGLLLYGWGAHLDRALPGRAPAIDRIVRAAGGRPHALATTQGGSPGHPLYVAMARVPFALPALKDPRHG